MNEQAPIPPRHHRFAPLIFLGALALVASAVASSELSIGFSSIVSWWLSAGWPAILYFAASIGLGRILHGPLKRLNVPLEISSALGLVFQLFITNVQISLASGLGDPRFAWSYCISIAPGLLGLIFIKRRLTRDSAPSPWRLMAFAPAGFLLAAACAPPGWLFGSEGGGYDSLSYHLQLPQEWIVSKEGLFSPVRHNLFSFFPNFVEGAFAHIAAISGVAATKDVIGANGLIADGGWRLLTCQMLHALMAIHAAWMIGALVRVACRRVQIDHTRVEWAVAIARIVVLLTPWFIVSGSLSDVDVHHRGANRPASC